jgi:hypothetical protein
LYLAYNLFFTHKTHVIFVLQLLADWWPRSRKGQDCGMMIFEGGLWLKEKRVPVRISNRTTSYPALSYRGVRRQV